MFNKKAGFTLAEVLVTLGIIGTISAITVPSLKKHSDLTEYAAGAKKAYASLASITRIIETEKGDIKRWSITESAGGSPMRILNGNIVKWYAEKMNIQRDCRGEDGRNCLSGVESNAPNAYKNPDGSTSALRPSMGNPTVTTMDNMGWQFIAGNTNCSDLGITTTSCEMIIFVDVNGNSKPNMMGVDTFAFALTKDRGIVPAGTDTPSNCTKANGAACTSQIIAKGKATYTVPRQ